MTALILGTAQFGSAYGITNAVGRLGDEDVRELLAAAHGHADAFDTAADYGDSQDRLGALAPSGSRYITKFSLPPEGEPVDADHLFGRSAARLGVEQLDGVLLHRVADLLDPRIGPVLDTLRLARASGAVDRVGVSIYDAADLELALAVFPDLSLLQIPGNIADRRMLDDPRIAALRAAGVHVHVRSVYLQGMLLADPEALPEFFLPLAPVLRTLREAAGTGSVAGVALRFLRDYPGVDGVIAGVTTPAELDELVREWAAPGVTIGAIEPVPADVLDPRAWPKVVL